MQQCPVDIEHIDHFLDMRRNMVMIESDFPSELGGMFKNVEQKGNPWGMNASVRNAWIEEVDFDIRVLGTDGEDAIPDDVEYSSRVGCAGAYEDRAKRTTKAVAELLHVAGVELWCSARARRAPAIRRAAPAMRCCSRCRRCRTSRR